MAHVLHECPNAPLGLLVSLQENYGYPEDETRIPLNTDAHENCPYCGVALTRDAANVVTLQQRADLTAASRTGRGVAGRAGTESPAVLEEGGISRDDRIAKEEDIHKDIKVEPASAKISRMLSARPRK